MDIIESRQVIFKYSIYDFLISFILIRYNGPVLLFFGIDFVSMFLTEQTVSWDRERSRGISTSGSRSAAVGGETKMKGMRRSRERNSCCSQNAHSHHASGENCTRSCLPPGESAYYVGSALFHQ